MPINQKGIELIKHFEGLRLTGYIDPVGIPTIGYGHTGPEVKVGETISEAEADQILRTDLEKFATGVRNRIAVTVSNNAFAALVSFAFNTGLGNFGSSTLLKKLNAGDAKGASKEFPRWVKGTINGKKVTLPGLVRRRKAERNLFDSADGAGATIAAAQPVSSEVPEAYFYIVRPGDSFVGIAAKNGLSIEALLHMNPHIADHNLLYPGDMIRFAGTAPVDDETAPPMDSDTPTAAMIEAPWYGKAKGELGVSEVKGKLHNNSRILDYHRSTTLSKKLASTDETPWCSSFVNWCVEGSGLKGTDSAMARSWLKWGAKLETPQEGCIVVFARPSAGPNSGHVAFFVKETAERIRVLGGNQSNQVKESYYGKDDLLGYRWPKGKPKAPAAEPVIEELEDSATSVGQSDAGEESIYFVQPGDTLQKIAGKVGLTTDQIRAWNPQITNPNRIFPGDSILLVGTDIPDPSEPAMDVSGDTPWFDMAKRELGTSEQSGSTRNNPRILEYHASTTLPGNLARIDETAWCSSFVNWCISRVGLKGTNSARARSWQDWGRKLSDPVPGCITVFSRPSAGPQSGHVAFYVSETATHIKVLGGNQSNQVKESNYPKSRLLSYRWPSDMPNAATGGAGGNSAPAKRKVRPPFLSRLKLFRKRILSRN